MYILVAEHPESQDRLADMLLLLGHEVTNCPAVETELLEQCQYNVYQMIILDVNIWHKALYQDIRATLGGLDSLIVVAGPAEQAEKILAAVEAGANDYLITPVNDTLLKTRFAIFQQNIPKDRRVDEKLMQLQKAVETMQLGVMVTDLEGMIAYVNPALAAMHGYDADELPGQPVGMLKSPESITLKKVARWRGMVREGVNIGKDGTPFPVWMTTEIVQDAEGEPYAIVSTIEDISERKEMEHALEHEHALLAHRVEERTAELKQANEELEIAAKLKDEFLESMTYELRNPLNVIINMTEALQEGVYGKLFGNLLNAITNIEKSGRSLLAIINDILDITKIRAGTLSLRVTDVPVKSLCRFSVRTVRPNAEKKNVEVSTHIDKHINTIQTEATRFQAILIHLLDNAVKFTPHGGKVGLHVKGERKTGLLHFTVWDTGFGIEEEDVGRLFAPFTQADETVAHIYGGTGLGLSLVYHIVELHRGCVTVESEPDEGSRFTMSFPWNEEDASELQTAQAPESKHPPKEDAGRPAALILLADPNAVYLHVVSDYLVIQGYRVLLAQDGEKALEYARTKHPDLLLLDINIPIMHGIEVIRRIRENVAITSLPVLTTTSIAVEEERTRCLAAGADDYLSKPLNLRVLVKRIENLLARHNE